MSSLNVRTEPWAAFPSSDTTLAQMSRALENLDFDLALVVDPHDFQVSLVCVGNKPPTTEALAFVMYGGEDPELLVTEETGEHERLAESFDSEAQDRNAEGA